MTVLGGVPEIVSAVVAASPLSACAAQAAVMARKIQEHAPAWRAQDRQIFSHVRPLTTTSWSTWGLQAGSALACRACRIEPLVDRDSLRFSAGVAVRRCSCVPVVRRFAFLAADVLLRYRLSGDAIRVGAQ